MKIYLFMLGVIGMTVLMIIAINAPQPTLTIDAKQMPLPQLLDTMAAAYHLNWYAADDYVNQHMLPVTCKATRAKMKEMLQTLERLEPDLIFQVRNIGPYQSLEVRTKNRRPAP